LSAEKGKELKTTVDSKANATQEAWITPTLLNGWVNYDESGYATCQYMKDSFGIVHVKGMVKGGSQGTAIFNLPAGYRLSKIEYFITSSNNALGILSTGSSGNVNANVANTAWVSLRSVSFKAEA